MRPEWIEGSESLCCVQRHPPETKTNHKLAASISHHVTRTERCMGYRLSPYPMKLFDPKVKDTSFRVNNGKDFHLHEHFRTSCTNRTLGRAPGFKRGEVDS